jgi:transcription elongation GreA/GreB family factor
MRYGYGVSKAFTREDDAVPAPLVTRRRVAIPDGVPNYVTAQGARALRAELAAGGDEVRMHEVAEHLACAEIVEPDAASDRVRFGSTAVTSSGVRYRIVGAIEADPRHFAVFWQSPVARALLGARVGDEVALPGGVVEIIAIA